jgi:hypothetical protein
MCKCLCTLSSLLESIVVRLFRAIEAYSSSDRTSEMYDTNRLSTEEKLYVIKLMSPRSFEATENILLHVRFPW